MSTLAQAKNSRIAEALNISSTDARFLQYLNEATERLLNRGKWYGTCGRFNISIDSQLLTLPAQIATIEQISVANTVLPLRTMWFELLSGGWGPRDETLPNGSGISECLYRGNYPTIRDIDTADILTVKADVLEDVGKEILILGYDSAGNWVRTQPLGPGTDWQDGETVVLAQGAGTASTTSFSIVTGVQAPDDLEGQWWLYLGTVAAGTLLGNYSYWETNPSYKRYLVPFVSTDISTVVVTGKLAYRPAVRDSDTLLIGNLPALKLACMALKFEEEGNMALATVYMNGGTMKNGQKISGAVQVLDEELQSHSSDGAELGISLTGSAAGYGEIVEALM